MLNPPACLDLEARLAGQAEEWLRLLQLGREVCLWLNVVPRLCRMCCHCPHRHAISLGQLSKRFARDALQSLVCFMPRLIPAAYTGGPIYGAAEGRAQGC